MTIGKRQALIFAAGLALGLGGAWLAFSDRSAGSAAPGTAAPAARVAKAPAPAGAASAAVTPTASATQCPAQTATALSDAKDGQFQLQADVSGKTDKDIGAFIVVGKEAAAAGRARDAEIAFLMSCRVAEQLKGGDSLPAADAKYQLAWHYANLGLHGGGANRSELLRRAERLYADSLEIYKARQGPAHEKTRFAAEGLAALRQPAAEPGRAVVAQAPPNPAPTQPAAPRAAPAPAPAAAAPPRAHGQPTAPATSPALPRVPPPATAAAPAPTRVQPPVPATPPPIATAPARPQPPAPPTPPATARMAPSAPTPGPAAARDPSAPPAPAITARAPTQLPAGARSDAPAAPRAPAQVTMGAPAQAQGSATVLAPPTARVAAAQGSATAGGEAGAPVRPSFDCAKARSRAERIICSDAELARQDRELGRLYARARDAAPDSGAFRRQNDQEWRRREATCDDRECLLRWYAQRRSQLNADLGEAR